MKVLVIGGSGFLGSFVADELSDSGYDVTIYDRVASEYLKDSQRMVVGDLRDLETLENEISRAEVVYNFAAISDLNEALSKPVETVEINILANVNILNLCKKHGIQRFVYASSIYVYSREGGFYRCSKQAAENYVEEFNKSYGLNYTILRYGSLYGPRSNESNGLYRIVKSALEKKIVSYSGSPDAMREYIHVIDAAKASVKILEKEFENESVVLTGQDPMKVADLLEMLAEILGVPGKVEFSKEGTYPGHYVRTPYAFQPKLGRTYIPPLHIDLGQGLLELIHEIDGQGSRG